MSVAPVDRRHRGAGSRAEVLETPDRRLGAPEHSRAPATVLAASARTEAQR